MTERPDRDRPKPTLQWKLAAIQGPWDLTFRVALPKNPKTDNDEK
jgi:hypothetical protein